MTYTCGFNSGFRHWARQRPREERPVYNACPVQTWGLANTPPRLLGDVPVSRPEWPRYPFFPLPPARHSNSDHASRLTSSSPPHWNLYDSTVAVFALNAPDHTTGGPSTPNPEWGRERERKSDQKGARRGVIESIEVGKPVRGWRSPDHSEDARRASGASCGSDRETAPLPPTNSSD